jgi:hypothetical protein
MLQHRLAVNIGECIAFLVRFARFENDNPKVTALETVIIVRLL